tara:strand:- start:250 stop:690 length:441 start_codon:yes stop_codon:yes gene_type:complete
MPRFSLETALKVRERLEKLYQKALAEQIQIEKQHRDIISVMKNALETHNSDIDFAKKNTLTINQLLMSTNFQKRISSNLESKNQQLNEHLEIVALKRKELTKATQKKRIFEILKEKEVKKIKQYEERLDRLEADEIAQNYKRFKQN